jgi:hypothetical protein
MDGKHDEGVTNKNYTLNPIYKNIVWCYMEETPI